MSAHADLGPWVATHDVLVLDLDDTIVATFDNGWQKTCAVARAVGRAEPTPDTFRALYGALSLEDCVARWFPGLPFERFHTEYERVGPAFPYRALVRLPPLIAAARTVGLRTAVLTNAPAAKVGPKLAAAGASAADFDWCLPREVLPEPKPSGRCFEPLAIASRQRERAASLLYVGDAAGDAAACAAAGVSFLAVRTGPTDWADRSGPTLDHLDQLRALLDSLA